ncbi:MAG: radical SAM protein [Beijerinckiaceae bacterium]|jgi:MoaA/NifB/PqqE/SkfB family radical SAM enzyme|nr:radical SAM protein [Beijerinckiaceae bacterium]
MATIFAWPADLKMRDPGLALTVIVPAHACNLSCSFCAIRQRKEIDATRLRPEDYVYFLDDIVASQPTAMISIQGYEPLLPEAWSYTAAILGRARELGVSRSLVTNGITLAERAAELAALSPTGITVSIDSADHAAHDKLRGKVGALAATLEGLRALVAHEDMARRISISSVLMPRKRHLLDGIPALMAELGVTHWCVSPLLRIGHGQLGGAVAPSRVVIDDVLHLHELAKSVGVEVVLDDELSCLEARSEDYDQFLIRRFDRPDGLVRLTPSGALSVGRAILRDVDVSTPVWDPSLSPRRFLRDAQAHFRAAA